MTYQCENCGQSTLETDMICWHCGQKLPRWEAKPEAAPAVVDEEGERPLSLTALAAYSGLTAAIVTVLLIVMQALGRQPQVALSLDSALEPGWTAVTDQNQLFTLDLPAQWQTLDRFDSEQEGEFIDLVRQNGQYQAALAPYAEMADDRQLLLLAIANEGEADTAVPPFILVARSQQLTRFTPEQVTGLLQDGPAGIKLHRSNFVEGLNGRQQTIHILTLPFTNQSLRCHHLFFNQEPDSFVVVGCATESDYGDYANIFHAILISFQPLLP